MTYNIETLTEDDVRAMIAAGNDEHNNQIRVTRAGEVYLSQDITGLTDIDGLKFRFETFIAGNGYVGPTAAQNDDLIRGIYKTLKANWPNSKSGSFIDIWEW